MDENPYKAPEERVGSPERQPWLNSDLKEDLIIIAIALPVAAIILAIILLTA